MRKIYTILSAVLLTVNVFLPSRQASAQAPQKMSYQAVIRNSSNALVTNTQVGMQISILEGSASGSVVYTETQTPTTNANGLVSIEIGEGAGFDAIDWASGIYFIKTETDPTGGTNYTITGTSQLLSVPYALHAKTVETITETDPTYTTSQAANITSTDIANLGNLSGENSGDQDISGIATNASEIATLQTEQTTQNTAIALNTAKVGVTTAQANEITANTGKDTTGIYHANRVALDLVSDSNTGDQDLSPLATKTALGDSTALVRSEIPIIPTGTATGDMQYWNGTAWVTVPSGTTGQLLSVNASGVPQWQNPSSIKTAATQAPTMNAIGVTFNGVLNPNGYNTTVAFEYSTDLSFSNSVTAIQSPLTSTTSTAVNSPVITSLTVGTTYHVRMVTQNIFGTFYGNDISFTYLYYGASYAGGLVFSIDNIGQHGLVCATTDHSLLADWEGAFIACAQDINGYTDWYLPSKSVLNLMYVNLHTQGLGGFVDSFYWSSNASNITSGIPKSWFQSFFNGAQGTFDIYEFFRVRAVRSF